MTKKEMTGTESPAEPMFKSIACARCGEDTAPGSINDLCPRCLLAVCLKSTGSLHLHRPLARREERLKKEGRVQ